MKDHAIFLKFRKIVSFHTESHSTLLLAFNTVTGLISQTFMHLIRQYNSEDKTNGILAWWRKFCQTKLCHTNFCPIRYVIYRCTYFPPSDGLGLEQDLSLYRLHENGSQTLHVPHCVHPPSSLQDNELARHATVSFAIPGQTLRMLMVTLYSFIQNLWRDCVPKVLTSKVSSRS